MTKTRFLASLAAAASLAINGAAPARADAPLLDVRGCLLSLHVFMDSPKRLQPSFVPSHYTPLAYVPGMPYVALWNARCSAVSVSGGPPRPASLSIAAVAVRHPDLALLAQPLVELPNTWAHYVHAIHSDHPELVGALAAEGFPAEHVAGMSHTRHVVLGAGLPAPIRPIAESRMRVPGQWSGWTRPPIQHEPAHSHQNTFLRDVGRDTRVLELRIPAALDHFCELRIANLCGTVQAVPGSAVAALMGAPSRAADASVTHEPVARGVAFTRTARYPR